MSDAPTYRIDKVADLLRVPRDRRAACLEELLEYLTVVEDANREFRGRVTHGGWAQIVGITATFTWVDDGKRDIQITAQEAMIEGHRVPADADVSAELRHRYERREPTDE